MMVLCRSPDQTDCILTIEVSAKLGALRFLYKFYVQEWHDRTLKWSSNSLYGKSASFFLRYDHQNFYKYMENKPRPWRPCFFLTNHDGLNNLSRG